MSPYQNIKIKCPKCGQVGNMSVLPSLNTALNPELKEKVISKEAFEYTCPGCLTKNHLNYTFLYHDPSRKLMIQFVAGDDKAWVKAVNEFRQMPYSTRDPLRANKYCVRAVRSQNQLTEKIQIFDAGLDDRVIEILKLVMLANSFKGRLLKKPDHAFFYKDTDGSNNIIFFKKEESMGALKVTPEQIAAVEKDYAAALQDTMPGELQVIDSLWAAAAIKQCRKAD